MNGRSDRVVLRGSERLALAAGAAHAPDATQVATVTLLLRRRSSAGDAVESACGSLQAGRSYVERGAFAERFGAAPADVRAVERFARGADLTIEDVSLARRSVRLQGTLAALAAAFGTVLEMRAVGGAVVRTRSGVLTLPAELDGIVLGVFGLDARPQARAQFRPAAAAAPASFTAPQVGTAYGFPSGVTGAGQTIALIELGGGYAPEDLATYFDSLGLAVPAVTTVSVDDATNSPTGTADGPDGEVELDIEVAGALAPGAKLVVYFAPNTDQGFLDAVTTAIHDSANAPTVLSISWGGPESTWTAQATAGFASAFEDAAMLGITVTVAAGDNGSSDGVTTDANPHVDFPASCPYVLACGGTTLRASGSTIESEVVWNDGSSGGATGGGVSDVFDLPAYQTGAGVPVRDDAGGKPGRGVPDVCGDADPDTGYAVVIDGASNVFGGTSAVAPLWAALVALLNERAAKPAGFINPTLYANPAALRDITSGTNGAFSAGPGWDACTGLGSPNGAALAALFPAPTKT